jgi:Transposase DDE domain
MSRTSYSHQRDQITMDGQVAELRCEFEGVKDDRAPNHSHKLSDIYMSGYAMFSLKYSSLLDFEQQTSMERENLHRVFGVNSMCSDAQLRRVLDNQDPDFLRKLIVSKFKTLEKTGILKEYEYKIGSKPYLILSCDGVEHFSSKKVNCPCCLKKEHKDGTCTYHHNMLCSALVHPEKREVFLIQTEPIIQQDGATKNDCERNAAKRLQQNMKTDYGQDRSKYDFLFVEDALYANVPHVKDLCDNGFSFILNVKPDGHKTIFAHVEGKRQRKQLETHTLTTPDGVKHRFEWCNNLPLCNADPNVRVNFMCYEQTNKKGKKTQFTWVTDMKITQKTIFPIMRAGRSRWKIENETFNTLKNLGYNFEHNYGHGEDHLSIILAYLMMLAFYIDQLIQACSKTFQMLEANILTKTKLWNIIKALFQTQPCNSFEHIYHTVAALFIIQLE